MPGGQKLITGFKSFLNSPPIYVGVLLGSICTCGGFVVANYSTLKEANKDGMSLVKKLSFAIQNSTITHSRSSDFIARPKMKEKIDLALTYESLKGDCYTIVYGPKGIGKTELVDHTAIGMKGVVKMRISSTNSKDEVIQSLTKKLLGESNSNFDVDLFIEAIKKCGIIPTIIFDVECSLSPLGTRDHVVDAVRSLSKDLAPYCRCIIVLSEANAVLQFGRDKRESFIYVDEMEREEAKLLLEKCEINLTDADLDYVFSNIGTSPLDLIRLAKRNSKTYSAKDYVADVLRDTRKFLVAFPHQEILKALKDHPEGVSPEYFHNVKDNGIDLSNPNAVGSAMKSVNAIVYRIELDKYMLMSTAHKTALQTYEPVKK